MARKKLGALLAILLSVTTAAMPIPVYASEQAPDNTNRKVTQGTLHELDMKKGGIEFLEEQKKTGFENTMDTSSEVTVIVELEGGSLLDYYNSMNQVSMFAANSSSTQELENFMVSSEAAGARNEMLSEQKNVIDQISSMSLAKKDTTAMYSIAGTSNNLNIIYQYTTVMNGFSAKVNASMVDEIKKISGVKNVFLGTVYEVEEPQMTSSAGMIGAFNTWDLSYQGEGMVVAVIDTGLDTNHIAFSKAPTSPSMTYETYQSIMSGGLVAPGAYVSEKIPFAYDYADQDNNVNPTENSVSLYGNDHGTHVAGTVAACAGETLGVAPEAQLVILKVGSDYSGGIPTEYMLAALDDAADIGVDVINMSIGAPAGFSDAGEEVMNAVYARLNHAGVAVSVSAGNNASSTENNLLGGHALAQNPDTAAVGSPSSFTGSTSVASVVNSTFHSASITVAGRYISYIESATKDQPKFTDLITADKNSYEYVVVPNIGAPEDYTGLDVAGKIAVVSRGSSPFSEKVMNAFNAGAIGIIVRNNQAGKISMQIDNYVIPAVSVLYEDGIYMTETADKLVVVNQGSYSFDSDSGRLCSDFSSWGVTPDLRLKPEIAAPGENIYSSVPFNKYESFNGTSMAAPHIAGTYALLLQYIRQDEKFVNLTAVQKENMATELLMSTAKPTSMGGIYYSPRKQGSGIANVYDAVTTKAYLSTDDAEINYRPKLDLGDDRFKAGSFSKSFYLNSLSNEPQTYTINISTLTENVLNSEVGYLIGESAFDISNYVSATAYVNGIAADTVTVYPNESVEIRVDISLTSDAIQYLDTYFPNGEFVDGFVFLTNCDTNGADLSIPFMGFYGDWTKASLFDESTIYDNNLFATGTNQVYSQAASFIMSDRNYLGVNAYDSMAYTLINNGYSPYDYANYYANGMLKLDPNKIAISPNGDGYMDTFYGGIFSMLRNAGYIATKMVAPDGSIVFESNDPYLRKTLYSSSNKTMATLRDTVNWAPETPVNNATYYYTVEGDVAYTQHESSNVRKSVTFPITIDIENPKALTVALFEENNRKYAEFTASDNQYLAAGTLGSLNAEGDLTQIIDTVLVNEDEKGKTSAFVYDITDYSANGYANLAFIVTDYAMNEVGYGFSFAVPDKVVLDQSELELGLNETAELKAAAYVQDQPVNTEFTWSSSNEAAAVVDNNGKVTAKAEGTTVITVSTWTKASASCTVTVVNMVPTLNTKLYNLEVGESKALDMSGISKNAVVTYKSNATKYATVSKDGIITAKKAGAALITITVKNGMRTDNFIASVVITNVPKVSIVAPKTTIKVKQSVVFLPKITGTVATYTWSSSDTKVATVGKLTGIVKGKAKGKATITLTVKTISGKKIVVTQDITVK